MENNGTVGRADKVELDATGGNEGVVLKEGGIVV
jgi:hypothetical protein